MNTYYTKYQSPIGKLTIVADDTAIKALYFEARDFTQNDFPGAVENTNHLLLQKTIKQLDEYFNGRRTDFDLSLAPNGTPFQKSVWKQLQNIPFGEAISYADLALKVGNGNASRAVGGANGRNPIPVIIPCHRVISSDGSLGGFSGGLNVKEQLLALEDIKYAA